MPSPNSEISQISEITSVYLDKHFPDLESEELKKELIAKTQLWESSTRSHIENENPFEVHRVKLVSAERDFRAHGGCEKSIKSDLQEFKLFNPAAPTRFWEKKICDLKTKSKINADKNRNTIDSIRRNEQESWRKDYEKQLLEWQLNEIQLRRNALLKDLDDWLRTLRKLQDVFEELGIEPGILWDTSAGRLSQQDISFLKKWAEYLKRDEGIRQLCELMGRLKKEAQSHHTEIINSTFQYAITTPDIHSNEEIVGIELGRDLENVIPQELALLSDPDVAILFDLKYVENRLMCFSKQGYKTEVFEEVIQEEVTVVDDDKLGPIIICVDTSGSMSGAPENIAKALTLTLSSRAVAQNRKCYLINFSTSIETLDLTPPKGINDLIAFLKMSFYGGTDVAPALYEGLRMMSEADFKKADLLVISDFVLSGLSADIVALCKKQREEENRFFALSIGSFGMRHVDEGVFDQNWIYNPKTGGISEINNILEQIKNTRRGAVI
jgi:uncharacterized protein with von Willebrand factor type A (vWA) domain